MRVFISWSGPASRLFARRFADWLPTVLQSADTYLSDDEVEAGTSIRDAYHRTTRNSDFVVLCVTQQALKSTWLSYEAGLLTARALESSSKINVASILLGLSPAELSGPLASIPPFVSDREGMWNLVRSINAAAGLDSVDVSRLDRAFDVMWPDLSSSVAEAGDRSFNSEPRRSLDDKVDEMLLLLRTLVNDRAREDERPPPALRDFEATAIALLGLPPGTVMDKNLADEVRSLRNRLAHEESSLSAEQRLRRSEIEGAILKQFNRWGRKKPQREIEFVWTGPAVSLFTDVPITAEELRQLEDLVLSSDEGVIIRGIYTRSNGPFDSVYERNIFRRYSGLSPDDRLSFTQDEGNDEGRTR